MFDKVVHRLSTAFPQVYQQKSFPQVFHRQKFSTGCPQVYPQPCSRLSVGSCRSWSALSLLLSARSRLSFSFSCGSHVVAIGETVGALSWLSCSLSLVWLARSRLSRSCRSCSLSARVRVPLVVGSRSRVARSSRSRAARVFSLGSRSCGRLSLFVVLVCRSCGSFSWLSGSWSAHAALVRSRLSLALSCAARVTQQRVPLSARGSCGSRSCSFALVALMALSFVVGAHGALVCSLFALMPLSCRSWLSLSCGALSLVLVARGRLSCGCRSRAALVRSRGSWRSLMALTQQRVPLVPLVLILPKN